MPKSNLMNTYNRKDVIFKKGIGSKLYDVNGEEYLDFVSGIAVNCLGHSNASIISTIKNQCEKLMHISNYYWNEQTISLAEKLCKLSDHDKAFFCNSGTEACEAAIKLARKYGSLINKNKNVIIHMKNSFHGRTLGALSITYNENYKTPFYPLIDRIKTVEFNNIDELKDKMNDEVCGVIIEPIQGEGGIKVSNKDFLKEARKLCDKFNSVLIFDEVQCGIGRTGKLFAYKNFDVIPDVVCMAKGLGGGFPIGAIIAKNKFANAFKPGDHGNTFGGNPLACTVALTVLKELTENHIIDEIPKKSNYLIQKLSLLKDNYKIIEEIRGKGLLLGIKVNINCNKIVDSCFNKKLLVISANDNVIRLLPPLNVSKDDIDLAINTLSLVFEELQ
ncbi:aspartate aminotransferase family protein [Clostridium novyi]|uniref:Acetylornithine aminotransferase n=1 Tax=Clostridium novyi (strain NT) TaxID=386415 RepID=A0Q1F2_CLONN|nr:aspartate aminotransferase family protein [Clostridium novyi]ABK61708.1 Acetylornithine aminotransferase (ACOAT) [Clostridium novyi NT]KEH88181.1 acetylornithine aminotransferase [Clostridium novyi A str. NCTC 538]KEH91308.1 acetylornithine aminotransferase [Clostridium novyi A str. BKT29909]KEH93682.1 acetylornithine aminotransferase [Clostridium novyi A str. GD211209]